MNREEAPASEELAKDPSNSETLEVSISLLPTPATVPIANRRLPSEHGCVAINAILEQESRHTSVILKVDGMNVLGSAHKPPLRCRARLGGFKRRINFSEKSSIAKVLTILPFKMLWSL